MSVINVSYKIIAKILANRLRKVLHRLISAFQNDFVPGRHIRDNVLIAHQMVEHVQKQKKG